MLSIVLPTFNEARAGYLPAILHSLQTVPDTELIIVDGGSTDGTLQQLQVSGSTTIELPASTRAARLNLGIDRAKGDCILLHHPRSLVPAAALQQVQAACSSNQPVWGGLTHQFDRQHPLLRFTSWYSNRVRFDHKAIVYLDHCLFFNRFFIARQLRLPDVAIFEDTAFCLRLRRYAKPRRLPARATTSAIRFTENGVIRQSLLNQALKLAWYLKVSPPRMNRYYEKGLNLNQ